MTYLKAYDDIRNLFAAQKSAQLRGFAAKHFSFNTEGGRCPVCQGDGTVTVEMQFMADVHLTCEQCQGKRFMASVLEVEFQGKSISDVLEMTVDEAMEFLLPMGKSASPTNFGLWPTSAWITFNSASRRARSRAERPSG